jgi:hypothetical protein
VRLIKDAGHDGPADSLACGWIAGRSRLLIAELDVELAKVKVKKRPWRKK